MRTDREECRYRIVAASCNQFDCPLIASLLFLFHLKDMMLFQMTYEVVIQLTFCKPRCGNCETQQKYESSFTIMPL